MYVPVSELFYSITLSNPHINITLLNKCSLRVSHEMWYLIHPTFFFLHILALCDFI